MAGSPKRDGAIKEGASFNIRIDVFSFPQEEVKFSEPQRVMSLIGSLEDTWEKRVIVPAGIVQKANYSTSLKSSESLLGTYCD